MKVAVLTISDGVAAGTRVDEGGPALVKLLEAAGHEIATAAVVPDEPSAVSRFLVEQADRARVELVLTTGGTGVGPRDITPEATRAVLEREAPGIAEAMRAESRRHTAMAALSRGLAGVRGRTLIVNLPGNPKAIAECVTPFLAVLEHAVDLLQERSRSHPR
jgi:molybdopterin adenylyltransferase